MYYICMIINNPKTRTMNNDNISSSKNQDNNTISDVNESHFKYIEIKEYDGGGVVKRLDVSGKTDRSVDTIENGMNINLNHDDYYTFSYDSEVELELI